MDETNLVSDILNWKDLQSKLTWYPNGELKNYIPFTQVYAICFNDQGEILVQRIPGTNWSLPGGTPEGEETPEQTLRREVIEESDVTLKNIQMLGAQRVQFLDKPNPNTSEGNDYYQLRFYCETDEILPQTPDPDGGVMRERDFISPSEITNYVKWGKIGDAIFSQATALYLSLRGGPPAGG